MSIYTSVDQLIGKTPLLELTNMEKELGLSLFIRSTHNVKLTPAGERCQTFFKRQMEELTVFIESERESQRRNAYATIKEINAFMMKGSGFFKAIYYMPVLCSVVVSGIRSNSSPSLWS